jgi:hypothetical protein
MQFFYFFYVATVQSTWGLKECKIRKYFYDLFNAGICSAEYNDKYRVTSQREFRVLTPMV